MPRDTPPQPDRREPKSRGKRQALIAGIADILLAEGVAQIPLRELAAALGTSDRMLLYYFDDKADLVRSSLQEVSSRLALALEPSSPVARRPPGSVFEVAVARFGAPAMSPFMAVWADIAARSARGEEPFRSFARGAVEGWLQWLDDRLDVADPAERRDVAAAILAAVEGARLLGASAPGAAHRAAAVLSRGFEATPGRRSGPKTR
jgi:AcrR family transcriptional regulator